MRCNIMKKRICLFLIGILAIFQLLTACSQKNTNNNWYYVDFIPDGDGYSVSPSNNIKQIKYYDEHMDIPAPQKEEITFSIKNKKILFTYTKPVPGYYGNYSYLYTAESGEEIKVSPSGTIVSYYIGKPVNVNGPITEMTEQEVIDIATKYAVEIWGEQFTEYYVLLEKPDLSSHIISVLFRMKTVTPGYSYQSVAGVFIDAYGDAKWIKCPNMYDLIDKDVPSIFTDEYIEEKCRELVNDKNAEIEYGDKNSVIMINNDTPALEITFRAKGSEHNITIFLPFN